MDERVAYAAVVGQVIQRLRAGKLSQQALASRAGLSQSALSRFENGQSLPDVEETRRLAKALERSHAQFVDLIERSFTRTAEVAAKVATGKSSWDGLAQVAVAGIAVLGVMAILDEMQKKSGNKR